GGRSWRIVQIRRRKVYVRSAQHRTETVAIAHKHAPPMGFWLSQRIKEQLLGASAPEHFTWMAADGCHYLFHFLGRNWGRLTAVALTEVMKRGVSDVGGVLLAGVLPFSAAGLITAGRRLEYSLAALRDSIVYDLELGPFFKLLPEGTREADIRAAVDLDGLAALLTRARLSELTMAQFARVASVMSLLDN
ncbi:hypothetical protein JW905_12130, partial [bacterium]|nr:hypothetical protein [candidate division CSSED10-310 bacterium]